MPYDTAAVRAHAARTVSALSVQSRQSLRSDVIPNWLDTSLNEPGLTGTAALRSHRPLPAVVNRLARTAIDPASDPTLHCRQLDPPWRSRVDAGWFPARLHAVRRPMALPRSRWPVRPMRSTGRFVSIPTSRMVWPDSVAARINSGIDRHERSGSNVCHSTCAVE